MLAVTSDEKDSKSKQQRSKILSQLAEAMLKSGETRKARRYAEQSLQIDEENASANLVMARLLSSIGDDEAASFHIERGLQADKPIPTLLAFAANLRLTEKNHAEAAKLYRRGQKAFPNDLNWTRGLARVMLKSRDNDGLMAALQTIAEREADKGTYARKLVQLALAKKDFVAAEKWANRVLHVDITNPIAHAQLAEALSGQNKKSGAIREYETALRLSPDERGWRVKLEELKRSQ